MNDNQRREIAQEYVSAHKAPIDGWTASHESSDPLLTIYYNLLDGSEVDDFDPELRTIEISARESHDDHPFIFVFDNEYDD